MATGPKLCQEKTQVPSFGDSITHEAEKRSHRKRLKNKKKTNQRKTRKLIISVNHDVF